ncbi:RICIN domain-containing protein [Kitasatospora viridis]|uniref:Ricin-type beta-trefoil lectin protein n=1 Tax=Kitasatospora viridis TaxID=281105 RepID=A0A561TVR3_9ACTN|nr:RICIN domain-containing protein [Kitasatospora viridis]TWF91200.1 ricin-type beta-trefoil lectin protein [Kitasatospora viridis]
MVRTTTRRAPAWLYTTITLALALATLLLPATAAHAATAGFTLGAARTDQNGNALQLHGLGIIKVGSTWYGFGEDKTGENSNNTSFQDIPCYSSTDLSSWTYQGVALAEQTAGDLGPNRIVERPKVIYNATTGTYVMYLHIDNTSYSEAKVGVATSTTPCGPYSYRGSFQPLGHQSRDLGLYQDTDGTAYLLSEDRQNGLRIDRLSADYLSVDSAVAVLGDYEAPAMMKIGGTYYLLGSHLSGWSTNDNVYATATSLSGPWSAFRDLAAPGTNTYNSQTANIITVQGSSGTSYVYAGDRWTTGDLGDSPLIWLPLTVRGTLLNLGQYPTWSLDAAAGTWTPDSGVPTTGTHTLTNAKSGKLMDVSGGSTANGAPIIQWQSNGGTNQQWTLNRLADNVYTLTSVKSGRCLEVPNWSTGTGLQLDQWTCNGGANQQWAADLVGSLTGSSYQLTNINSGLTVEVSGASTTAGAAVDQGAGSGAANQQWTLS